MASISIQSVFLGMYTQSFDHRSAESMKPSYISCISYLYPTLAHIAMLIAISVSETDEAYVVKHLATQTPYSSSLWNSMF